MPSVGKWFVDEQDDCILLSGGYLSTSADVIRKVEELLGHPINHDCSVSERRRVKMKHGLRFYYHVDFDNESDIDGKFKELVESDDNEPYYSGLRKDNVGFKTRAFMHRLLVPYGFLFSIRDAGLEELIVFKMLEIAILGLISIVELKYFIILLIVFVFIDVSYVFQIFCACIDLADTVSIPVRNGMVYAVKHESSIAGTNPICDESLNRIINRINQIWKRKNKNFNIYKNVKSDTNFIIVDAPGINKKIPYEANEFIEAYSNDDKLKQVTIEQDKSFVDKQVKRIDLLALKNEIYELESKMLGSNTISKKVDAQIYLFLKNNVESEVAYTRLVKQLNSIKEKLVLMDSNADSIDDAIDDLSAIEELRKNNQ